MKSPDLSELKVLCYERIRERGAHLRRAEALGQEIQRIEQQISAIEQKNGGVKDARDAPKRTEKAV